MAQYSVFCHGTATRIETPEALIGHRVYGWGTVLKLRPPAISTVGDLRVREEEAPGTWCHLAFATEVPTFGRKPILESVTLLFSTERCRIKHIHLYDGADKIADLGGLSGTYWNAEDIQTVQGPLGPTSSVPTNTKLLRRQVSINGPIGLSFYVCTSMADYRDFDFYGEFPPGELTFAGAGMKVTVGSPIDLTFARAVHYP